MPRVKTAPALYITVPRALAFDARHHTFDPFELAIIGGILTAAHRALGQQRHAARFAKGALSIKKERELAEKHKADWQDVRKKRRRGVPAKAPMREHVHRKASYKTGSHAENLQQAGSYAYQKAGEEQRSSPIPDTIPVTLSRSRLLVMSGLSRDGANLARLDRTLKRLRKPFERDGHKQPALLISVSAGESLTLEVSGDWFAMPYVRAPLPLPTRSRPAAALYLFSLCISTSRVHGRPMNFKALCDRIGISLDRFRQRSFDRALGIVNDHLGRLDEEALHWHRIRMPARLEVEPEQDGPRLLIVGVPRTYRGEQGYDFSSDKSPRRRRKVKRYRAPGRKLELYQAPQRNAGPVMAMITSEAGRQSLDDERRERQERARAE